jgi:Putative peptidoglycan binding domain
MADLSARRWFPSRRVVLVAAAVVVAGGAVGGGVTVALAGNSRGGAASSPGGSGSVATAPVQRTTLVNTVQEGGSLGYGGSYTVSAPSGASAAQVSQQEQLVAQDKQAVSGDDQAMSDSSASGNQSVSAAEANVKIAQSTLSADQATEAKDCAGSGGSAQAYAATPLPTPTASGTGSTAPPSSSPPSSSPSSSPAGTGGTGGSGGSACGQDQQKVAQDQNQLTQAQQQLASAETTGKTNSDQTQSKAAADQVKLQGDEATLAQLRETAMNPGTAYTWLPAVGAVIRQDQPVYRVSGEPVPLLYGAIPAYRAFYVGMSDGGDVGELTHDLITLGFGAGLTQGDHYSSATATAVQRWQRKLGLPQTGEILLGEVVFEPGPMRVTSVTPTAGSSYGSGGGGGGGAAGGGGGGTVLSATGITPVVTVSLTVTQEYLVKPGDAVSVVLPNGTSTAGGHVESVGTVATCSGGGTTGTGGSSNSGGSGSSPCSSSGSSGSAGSNSTPTVTVTISLNSTLPGSALDQAPVNVNITAQSAGNVLAVPVNALLALSGGGYGVDVVSGGAAHLVGVTTGLYSSTLVQVSGPGIAAGELVEVPSS